MIYIGKAAEQTGATHRAIRLYEEQGLIPPPQRRGNYRVYSETEVKAIALIRRAQVVGFTLRELKEMVNHKVRENRFPLQMANALFDTNLYSPSLPCSGGRFPTGSTQTGITGC